MCVRLRETVKIILLLILAGLLVQMQSLSASGQNNAVYPQASFIVLSDLHFYDSSLGISGSAFQDYLDHDRKLLKESEELIDTAISEIKPLSADFVIISGDLTKDGEKLNHQILARKLQLLKQSGKKVFVIPGNHDIANGDAVRFVGDHKESVETVTGEEFADIYREFGYEEAIERDSHSLSYVAEPVSGLWLLGIDSNKWKENKPDEEPHVDGAITDETLSWIDSILIKAREGNKAVVVFMHHGIMEHYPNNLDFYSDYIVDNHEIVAAKLANSGVKLVFTGHFHAQDITQKTIETTGNTIFDIETGSLVTAPCPYRIVEITSGQEAVIQSRFITSIPSHPADFKSYSETYVFEGTKKLADDKLKGYWVSESDRELINPQAI